MDLGAAPWRDFAGIRIVGDVHGDAANFRIAAEQAAARDLFVVQIGDLVDRGPDSVGALRLALDLCGRGAGLFLRANHDDKLRRALCGNPVQRTIELRRTLLALESTADHDKFIPQVREALATAPWWVRIGNLLAVHGGFHPAMLTAPQPEDISPRKLAHKCRSLAIHGEGRGGAGEDDLPKRTYNWIDTVPAEITVVIGHDVVATDRVVERRGRQGGRVLFRDTRAGKNGKLSWIDIPREMLRC